MFEMNLLPTISSSSSLIVSIGNTKTTNLPYQATINDIKPIVLDFQNEALTYAIKPFDRRYDTADLPYQAPIYDIKPLVLDEMNLLTTKSSSSSTMLRA